MEERIYTASVYSRKTFYIFTPDNAIAGKYQSYVLNHSKPLPVFLKGALNTPMYMYKTCNIRGGWYNSHGTVLSQRTRCWV